MVKPQRLRVKRNNNNFFKKGVEWAPIQYDWCPKLDTVVGVR